MGRPAPRPVLREDGELAGRVRADGRGEQHPPRRGAPAEGGAAEGAPAVGPRRPP